MLKKYEDYKETQISYLGSLPSHWNILPLRSILFERKEKNIGKKNNEILSVMANRGVILYSEKGNVGNKASDNIERYNVVYEDDIVLNCMNVIIGSVGRSPYNGVLSPVYYVLVNRNTQTYNTRYYDYVFKLKPLQSELKKYGKGILAHRMRISMDSLKSLNLPCPPIEEQNQVVKYLDWKLSKINKLIRAKKKQIALLNEQKQVIIHNAVTKGVDPNVPMKDSGIEWIGQIPQEWVVNRLKTQISLSTSKKNRDNEFYIGMENIQSWTGKYVSTTEIDSEGICNIFENNNILFGKLRPYLAKVYLTENNGVCSSEFLVLKNFNGILRYMFYILLSYKFIDLVNSSTYGAKMPRANWDFIGNCSIPIPSLEEQNKIASYLDDKCYKIENLKAKIQNEIELLYEYRTRLISDVVTGKVDVRDIEIPEYEADSDETIDDEIDDNLVLDEEDGEMEVE